MGSETSKFRMQQPLRELLKNHGTPLKEKTAKVFLDTVERVSPWFLDEGLLNTLQWEQLGEDLHIADRQNPLPVGTMAIWSLIKSCLQDKNKKPSLTEPLAEGRQVLEEIKEERSYLSQNSEKGTNSDEELSEGELSGEELEKRVQRLRLDEKPPLVPVLPSAPPINREPPHEASGFGLRLEWSHLGSVAYPVFEDAQNQRCHQPLDFKIVKQLKEAVSTYGPQSAFTIALVDTLTSLNLVPQDWTNLARAALSGGQYLMWKTSWQEISTDTARRNAAAGNPQVDRDMLMGVGPYETLQAQLNYHPAVYAQIAVAATKAWKTLQGAGDLQGQLSKEIGRAHV